MGDEVDFLPADKHESFLQDDNMTLGVYSQECTSTQNNRFSSSLQYLQENIKDEVDFLLADKRQSFQIDNITLGMCGQACPNIQSDKFAISLQYLKKEVSAEVDFVHADKHETLIKIDTMILVGIIKYSQSSQNSKFAMSLQYLKKEVRDEVDFLHVSCKLISTFCATKFPAR